MNEGLYWALQTAIKDLEVQIEAAKKSIRDGDSEDAIKILDGVLEDITGQIVRRER